MDYFNIVFSCVSIFLCVFGFCQGLLRKDKIRMKELANPNYILMGIVFFAAAVRIFRFNQIPGGINPDEASLGYDAFATAFFGMDRNGVHNPVYAISWGSGQNVLYMYVVAFFVRMFGLSAFVVRTPMLITSILTVPMFYYVVKKAAGVNTALFASMFLAIAPWHILLSRWALESNFLPFVFLGGVCLLIHAAEKKNTLFFVLAAGVFSLSMYAYATVCFVMPLFLGIVCGLLLLNKMITPKQLLLSGLCFLIAAVPLALFYIVNLFELDPIITPLFTVPRMTEMRNTNLDTIPKNLMDMLGLLVMQEDMPWNVVPGFGAVYLFMTPFTVIGFWSAFKKRRENFFQCLMLVWFFCSAIVGAVVSVNINRINLIFLPMIFLIAEGVFVASERAKFAVPVVCVMLLAGFSLMQVKFHTDASYRQWMDQLFAESYEDAVKYAETFDREVFVADDVRAAHILTLFYLKTQPQDYIDTVQYLYHDVEFRPVMSYGHFIFEKPLPPDLDSGMVYITSNYKAGFVDKLRFDVRQFDYYSVISAKPEALGTP